MNKQDLLLEKWRLASQLHRHMDDMVWRRFSYFMGLNGILVSALALIWVNGSQQNNRWIGTAGIAAFGALTAYLWSKMQKRAQLYHAVRSRQAGEAEEMLLESISDPPTATEKWPTIYGRSLEDHREYKKAKKNISCVRWGLTPTYELVFWLTVILAGAWTAVALFCLALHCP